MSYVFLDRDGTLIRHCPYLCDARDVELLPTVVRGLEELRAAGCKLFLHTNQSGIGRGYFPLANALACNDEMLRQIGLGSDLFTDICLCPESPDQEVFYRKPSPNYAREVMAKYAIGCRSVCYVGDNITDLLTANNVGCAGVGVNTGVHDLRRLVREHGLQRFPVFDNFLDAALHVVGQLGCSRATA
jgi:D-glycero-D-manno-heptose 1,7-bisphosphate phosphatase